MSPENQYVTVEGQADQIVLSNEYFLGEELYKDNCAYCHEGGIPKAPHRDWLDKMSPDTVLRDLNEGVLKRVAESLSLQERRYVVEYIRCQPSELCFAFRSMLIAGGLVYQFRFKHYFFFAFFLAVLAVLSAMAMACFCGLPDFISVLMFFEMVPLE